MNVSQKKVTLVVVLLFILTLSAFGTAAAEVNDAVINEYVADHTGSDEFEFVEIFGDADTDHSDLTILQIEGDSGSTPGVIDSVLPVGTTDADGFWVTDFMSNELENGTITLLLVSEFTGSEGDDIDTDDDGIIDDSPPWTSIIDDVAVDDGGAGDFMYSAVILSADYDGVSFTVDGASRIPNGMDTDTDTDWMRNDYHGAGLPGMDGSPVFGEAFNTPGAENEAVPEPVDQCGDEFTPIYDIQGTGDETPYDDLEVSTEGIVVGDFQGASQLNGFYIQDPIGDGDDETSDALFVYAPGSDDVDEGDAVRVRGTAGEFSNQTQISDVVVVLNCTDDDTPLVEPTPFSLPVDDLDDWEMVEGMLVNVTNDMFVTDVYNLAYRGETILAAGEINFSPTNVALPGAPQAAVAEANTLKSIILDDGSNWTNPWITTGSIPFVGPEGTLRIGDYAEGVTAIAADNRFGRRLQPTTSFDIAFNYIPRPDAPTDVGGTIKVASYNILNFWTTLCEYPLCRGAEDEEVFAIQSEKLAKSILALDADVIGLQELENHFLDEDPDNDDDAVNTLVEVLNEMMGSDVWSHVPTPSNPREYDNNNAIMNGIIYRNDRVSPVEGMSWWLDDPSFNGLVDGTSIGRAPIAQTFDARGEIFTVVSNHFKSKSTRLCPDDPADPDADQGDGQGCFNNLRTLEAEALVGFVELLKTESGDADVVVLGDFNSYAMEDPAQTLNNYVAAGEVESLLINQLSNFLEPEEQNTYVFRGGNGALDYIYTTAEMASIPTDPDLDRVTGLDIFHINHDEPDGFTYFRDPQLIKDDPDDPAEPWPMYRSSDHDPVLVGFCDAVPPVVTVEASPSWIWPPNHRYHTVDISVSASDNFDPEPTIWHEDEGWYMSNEPDNGTGDGNTTDDMILVEDGDGTAVFKVRAERAGHGSGRTYTFTYKATDSCGNIGEGSAIVFVPHDMRNKEDLPDRNAHMNIPRLRD